MYCPECQSTKIQKNGKKKGKQNYPETTPQVGELDELETFVGQKKTRFGKGDSRRPFQTRHSGGMI